MMYVTNRTGWEVSALGYGKGGSRIFNDDWSGELQRACRFGTNLLQVYLLIDMINVQITIGEEFMDENYSGYVKIRFGMIMCRNPSGFIHPHGMLHGLLTCDQISRDSMIVTSKVCMLLFLSIDLLAST